MFSFFKNILKQRRKQTPESNLFMIGHNAFQSARKLDLERNDDLSLKYYDVAIACGFEEAYSKRAFVLQALNYDLDAIDDFNKAIRIAPEDCNLFFGRHHSKSKIRDSYGALNDINQAILLSKLGSNLNKVYDDKAQKLGYQNTTALYESYKVYAQQEMETPQELKNANLNRRV